MKAAFELSSSHVCEKRSKQLFPFSESELSQTFCQTAHLAVRVKGGMSLRNGTWHGLQNEIIMRNVKYGKWRKEIN